VNISNKGIRERIVERLSKFEILIGTPSAWRARRLGCYLDMYKTVYRLRVMGLRPRTILDIGANRGMFSRCCHFVFPRAEIYAFEPLRDCYRELLKLKNEIPRFECFSFALAERTGESFIHRSSYDFSSSLLDMGDLHKEAFPYSASEKLEKIEIRTLDQVLDGRNLERPLLVKIDVQGSEKFVILGALNTLERADYVVCEMSLRQLYKGQALFDEVYTMLLDAGFRFSGQTGELRHPKSSETLQIDGLFTREKQ
jgi:FkbM family methyltransferase